MKERCKELLYFTAGIKNKEFNEFDTDDNHSQCRRKSNHKGSHSILVGWKQ